MPKTPQENSVHRGGRPKGSRDKAPRKRRTDMVSFPNDLERNCKASRPEISNLLMNSLYWLDKPKPRTEDEIEQRVYEFFARVAQTGEIPTVEKLSLALGISSSVLYEWQMGRGANGTPRRAAIIKMAKQFLASFDAELVSNGKLPVASYIFRAKNFFGMRDEPDQETQGDDRVSASAEDLVRLYGETGGADDGHAIEGEMTGGE